MENKPLVKEVWNYFKVRKKWWLLPPIILLIIVGAAIIILGNASAVSPFIYVLF